MVDTTNGMRKGPGIMLPSWLVGAVFALLVSGAGVAIAWGENRSDLRALNQRLEIESAAARKIEEKVNNIYGTLERLDERSRQQQQLLEEIKRRLWAPPDRVPM